LKTLTQLTVGARGGEGQNRREHGLVVDPKNVEWLSAVEGLG